MHDRFYSMRTAIENFRNLSRTKKILLVGGITAGVLIILALITTIFFAATLSSKERIMNRNSTGVTLQDREGKTFYEFNNPRSETYVELNQIAPVAREAVIASEDKSFYEHPGFSVQGIAKAVYENIKPGGINSGGSTITQQLVKNALLSQDRSILRKYQELVLSVEIERQYSKDEILEMYLNSVYFGEGYFGIEDAARGYFGVGAKELNVAQAAMLAGVLPAPAAYSPISGDPKLAKERQDYVLGRMVEDGKIEEDRSKAALAVKLQYRPQTQNDNFKAPHFALMVKAELEKEYGEEQVARSGFIVKTTLDLAQQTAAETAVLEQVNSLAGANVSNGAAVILDPGTGEIRALVGSKDYANEEFGKVNMATSPRQPGSSIKPIVYATGIEEKTLSAATILNDKPTDFGGGYTPENYDLGYRGDVTVRRALANSLNIPAVQALDQIGVQDVLDQAKQMGISTFEQSAEEYGLSLALGSGSVKLTELTNAFSAFGNQGDLSELQMITAITDKYDDEVFTATPKSRNVLSPETAYIISSILSDNNARAETFGDSLSIAGYDVAVKTGTTEDYRDSLTVGYTPSLAIGVWVGNNDNSPTSRVAGSAGAGPIWQRLMSELLSGTSNEEFPLPPGIEARQVCIGTGKIAVNEEGRDTYTEYFRSGTVPNGRCNAEEPKPEPKPRRERDTEVQEETTPVEIVVCREGALVTIPEDQQLDTDLPEDSPECQPTGSETDPGTSPDQPVDGGSPGTGTEPPLPVQP